jgi:multiple sugar transport system permease protein
MTAAEQRARAHRSERIVQKGKGYLIGAVCVALCAIMVMPLLLTVSASLKTTLEAAALPPTYVPRELSLDSYVKLWGYQAGLLTYVFNSGIAAGLTIVFCLILTIPAGYSLARFHVPGKEALFVILLLALIIPYQALLTPLFFTFIRLRLTNSLVGLAIVHTAIQLPFSVYIMRNAFESLPIELDEASTVDGCSIWQALVHVYLPSIRPAIVTVSLFAFITSWNELLGALVMMSKGTAFTLPIILAVSRTETSIGGTDWGLLQAGITISIVPCVLFYLLLQKYYVSGLLSGAGK